MSTAETKNQSRVMTISVCRYNPETDKKLSMQDYKVELDKVDGKMLLSVLLYIKDHLDDSLTFRRSCAEGICGSDGMNINGQNGLACITELVNLPDRVELRPLPSFPVLRDLVVDMTQFYTQYEKVKPYLVNNEAPPARERLQSPEERAKLDGLYECVLCACCSSSCPSYWWNPEKYLGPAALLQAKRFIVDSRDTMKEERLAAMGDAYSAYRCHGIMNCTTVCPKHLNPAAAITDIKQMMLAAA
jgi:succinate dehydrogenase / fumarate reductase iron-sulfur subunit